MLTRKQQDLFEYIEAYLADNGGVSPCFVEMQTAMGLASKSGIHRLVNALEERGFIRRMHHLSRAIEVLRPSARPDGVVSLAQRRQAEAIIKAVTNAYGEDIDEDGITIVCSVDELRATVLAALT